LECSTFYRDCPAVSAEQVITVPLRSVIALLVDIMDISGRDELSFRDLEIYKVVRVVCIGVTISAVPSLVTPLLNSIGG
jgi:hypothetical protein